MASAAVLVLACMLNVEIGRRLSGGLAWAHWRWRHLTRYRRMRVDLSS